MRLAGGTASHQLPSRGNTTPRTTGDGADRAHGTIRVSTSPGRALADGYFRLASQRGPLPGHQFDQSRWSFAAADLAHVFVNDFVEIRGGYVERFQPLRPSALSFAYARHAMPILSSTSCARSTYISSCCPSSVSNADTMIFPPMSFGRIACISAL